MPRTSGCLAAIAPDGLEHGLDVPPLDFPQRLAAAGGCAGRRGSALSDAGRQVLGTNHAVLAEHGRALEDVFQFPDVAGPGVAS